MKIVQRFFIATVVFLFLPFVSLVAQQGGEATFKESCASCHTIGRGKLVGPDLANVENRHSKEWIQSFVKSSQTVIKSGDKYADSLFKAFNQMPMPDHPNMTNAQIDGIIAYISEKSSASSAGTATAALPPGNSKAGKELFVGNVRFKNRAAACNSCHNVDMKGVMSGGALGKDLTHAITRLSPEGVAGIVTGLPFPQMKETYDKKPLTPQEVSNIVAFLKTVDKTAPAKATSIAGNYLLVWGAAGFVILLILFSIFWMKRKNRTVNLALFRRQIRSA